MVSSVSCSSEKPGSESKANRERERGEQGCTDDVVTGRASSLRDGDALFQRSHQLVGRGAGLDEEVGAFLPRVPGDVALCGSPAIQQLLAAAAEVLRAPRCP